MKERVRIKKRRVKRINKRIFVYALSALLLMTALPVASAGDHRHCYVLIVRDDYGVPHVFASTKEGLGFGAGYAMAQDRLWQADVYRRAAFGRLAEIGLASVEDDYAIRAVGYSWEELGEMFENWVPTRPEARLKEMALAFVDGVNLYIAEATAALLGGDPSMMPLEYLAYGLIPEPWAIEDSMAVLSMMAWRFGGCGGDELKYAAALQALQGMYGDELGWLMFNDHFPQNDPGAEVTIPSNGCQFPKECGTCNCPTLPGGISGAYQRYEDVRKQQIRLFESLGVPMSFGSNAWMISPRKSESRNAMQVGGPQMGQSIPQIVLEIGLHGAGISAVGMMMPMFPSILIGVSEHGAWTSTTGVSDVMDTYIEVLNPEDPQQYLYNGGWTEMEERIETIYDAFGTPHYYPVYRTVHGPVVGYDLENGLAFTMKTPYYMNDVAAEEGWSLFQQARNILEFQEAVKTIQPAHNFYWIDRRGNIGYWHAGTFPIKPATGKFGQPIDDRFPLWGTGEEEWLGVTGFAEMPKCINPKQGWLANWNNKPIADWPYGESDAGWGEGHRVKRIMDVIENLLATKGRISFEDMNLINMDAGYNHIPGMNLLHYVIDAAINDPSTEIQAALPYLEAWNHHYNDLEDPRWPNPAATYDDIGLTIFDAWYEIIFNEVFEDDIPPYGEIGPIHREYARVWPSTLIHVFDGPESKLPLNYDYLNGEDKDEVITRVLKWAIGNLTEEYGSDMSTWLTPIRTVTFDQTGALPAPTMHEMNRGTYNHIAEMPAAFWHPPHAVDVIPPGQSGFINYLFQPSPHAYDQLILYETWTYKQMRFRVTDIVKVAESWKLLYY